MYSRRWQRVTGHGFVPQHEVIFVNSLTGMTDLARQMNPEIDIFSYSFHEVGCAALMSAWEECDRDAGARCNCSDDAFEAVFLD